MASKRIENNRFILLFLLIFLIFVFSNVIHAQIESSKEYFQKLWNKAKGKKCSEQEYLIWSDYIPDPSLYTDYLLGILWLHNLDGWGKYLQSTYKNKDYCAPKEEIDNLIDKISQQVDTLDELVFVFEWPRKIISGVQYSSIDKLIQWITSKDPYFSDSVEKMLKQPNACVIVLQSFVNNTPFYPDLIRNTNVQSLINEGLNTGIITKKWKESIGGGIQPSYSVNMVYEFDYQKLRNQHGENLSKLYSMAQDLIKNYYELGQQVKDLASKTYEVYKAVKDLNSLNYFYSLVQEVKDIKARYKNLYMTGTTQESTCHLLLSVIIKGETPAGKNVQEFEKDIFQPYASDTQEIIEQVRRLNMKITPAKVEVTTTEQPIAVIPPIIFSEEHQGTSSFASITPERIFDEIKNFVFKLAPTLFILLLIIGGIFYLLAPVNLKNIQTGSEYIKWAVIGYFVLLVITGILAAVRGIFGGP